MNDKNDILSGPIGALFKFIASAMFGGVVTLVIFLSSLFWIPEMFDQPWVHVFWIIPLLWGVLGIFWFDQMLDWGKKIMEELLGVG